VRCHERGEEVGELVEEAASERAGREHRGPHLPVSESKHGDSVTFSLTEQQDEQLDVLGELAAAATHEQPVGFVNPIPLQIEGFDGMTEFSNPTRPSRR
jgi:hypothetical protein